MATNKKCGARTKGKANKTWSDKELNAYAIILSSTEERDKPWALVPETLALKKTANESLFTKINEELEDTLVAEGISPARDSYTFTVDQLRDKYKWLKKKWREININVKSGSGLGAKDTATSQWYEHLDQIFTESVDSMTEVSSKASDILDEESIISNEGESENSGEDSSDDESEVNAPPESKMKKTDSKSDTKIVSNKETKVKVKRQQRPRTQTRAVMEMVKMLKDTSNTQEKNSDGRLKCILEAERKRDEMMLMFQREQAEANRKHEMLMAQMLMQLNRNPLPLKLHHPNRLVTSPQLQVILEVIPKGVYKDLTMIPNITTITYEQKK